MHPRVTDKRHIHENQCAGRPTNHRMDGQTCVRCARVFLHTKLPFLVFLQKCYGPTDQPTDWLTYQPMDTPSNRDASTHLTRPIRLMMRQMFVEIIAWWYDWWHLCLASSSFDLMIKVDFHWISKSCNRWTDQLMNRSSYRDVRMHLHKISPKSDEKQRSWKCSLLINFDWADWYGRSKNGVNPLIYWYFPVEGL